jgi:hypothetical protein
MSMPERNLRRILALVPLILKTEVIASPSSLAYARPTRSSTSCKSNCGARYSGFVDTPEIKNFAARKISGPIGTICK